MSTIPRNVKLSQYTSQDVMASLNKAFDSYWNDEEFELFDPSKEDDHKQLKASLEETEESTFQVFFDLHPYSHQKEILEDLQTERELFDSYKNLIVAATGARVIIVIGCNNALVARVSEAFIGNNSCIAKGN